MPLKDVLRLTLASVPESAGKIRLADRNMAADVTHIDSMVCTTPCNQMHLHITSPDLKKNGMWFTFALQTKR